MTDTPLLDAFHKKLGPQAMLVDAKLYNLLCEFFMSGAGAHDRIMTEATGRENPEHLAAVLDGMVDEMEQEMARIHPKGAKA